MLCNKHDAIKISENVAQTMKDSLSSVSDDTIANFLYEKYIIDPDADAKQTLLALRTQYKEYYRLHHLRAAEDFHFDALIRYIENKGCSRIEEDGRSVVCGLTPLKA
jgi:hypothetical protein